MKRSGISVFLFCVFVFASVAHATHDSPETNSAKARAEGAARAFGWTQIGVVAAIRSTGAMDELPDNFPKDQKKLEKDLYERTLPHLRVDGKSKLVKAEYIGAGAKGLSGRTERVVVTIRSAKDGGTTEWVATYIRQPDRILPRGDRERVWQVSVKFRQIPS